MTHSARNEYLKHVFVRYLSVCGKLFATIDKNAASKDYLEITLLYFEEANADMVHNLGKKVVLQ